MTGTQVAVATIKIDPPYTPCRTARYKIALQCGCSWWEDRAPDEGPPPDTTRICYHAGHAPDPKGPVADRPLPAHAESAPSANASCRSPAYTADAASE